MQIKWTEEASDSIEQTLDYWYRNNGSFTYSEKILNETEKVQKEIIVDFGYIIYYNSNFIANFL